MGTYQNKASGGFSPLDQSMIHMEVDAIACPSQVITRPSLGSGDY